MVVRNCTLDVDIATIDDLPTMMYVVGGHFNTAFEAAIIRTVSGMNMRYIGGDFSGHIFHEWWVEHDEAPPSSLDTDDEAWVMRGCDQDTPGSFPVTVIYLNTLNQFFVYVCQACSRGHHHDCAVRHRDPDVYMYPTTGRRWTNDPTPF